MLRRLTYYIMFICVLFVFSGCADFFTFNLFDGLDYVAVPSAADLDKKTPEEGVGYLKDQFTSDSFMDALERDPEAAAEISTYLEGIYIDPNAAIDTDIQVSAAVLAADLELAVSGGDVLIDNVWNAFVEIQALNSGESGENSEAIQTILTGIVPENITDEAAFTTLVKGVLAAGAIYETLGDTIITNPVEDNCSGDITGGVVFNAAVTGILTSIISQLLLPAYATPDAAPGVLWALFTSENPETVPGINPTADLGDPLTNLTFLQNIAEAAGADLAALFGTAE